MSKSWIWTPNLTKSFKLILLAMNFIQYKSTKKKSEVIPRIKFYLSLITILALSIILLRAFHLQILQGEQFAIFSQNNVLKKNMHYAPRGIIYDRNLQVLASNQYRFDLSVVPQYMKDIKSLGKTLEKIIQIPASDTEEKIVLAHKRQSSFIPISIKKNLNRGEIEAIIKQKVYFPEIILQKTTVRKYPLGQALSHLIGYVGPVSKKEVRSINKNLKDNFISIHDFTGKKGIEKFYDQNVRGQNGHSIITIDATGREVGRELSRFFISDFQNGKQPNPGQSIQLTIDRDLQRYTYKLFEKIYKRVGAVVVMKPTGQILAWHSSPSFDPHIFSQGPTSKDWKQLTSQDQVLRNQVIQEHQAPGSTIKPFVALASLAENIILEDTQHTCTGTFYLSRYPYRCNRLSGHGPLNMLQALEHSCNVFFYAMGNQLGIETLAKYLTTFGFGKKNKNSPLWRKSRPSSPSCLEGKKTTISVDTWGNLERFHRARLSSYHSFAAGQCL